MHIFRTGRAVFALFFIVSVALAPAFAEASSSDYGGAYRSKTNKLAKKPVKEILVPILFGVTLKTITPNFGDPRDGGARKHEGLDVMAPLGGVIISPTDAVVLNTGTGPTSGKYVMTANPGGEVFFYMHLSKVLAKKGQVLKPAGVIGYVGDTGNAKGGSPHLHFEIRKGKKPTDPYLRIKKEFTLKEKFDYLEDILGPLKNKKELVSFIAKEYPGVLYQAHKEGVILSSELLKVVPKSTSTIVRDLELGDEGEDVMALQSVLISGKYLDIEAPTGYFGAKTKVALIAYQEAHKISPATGYYGASTRAFLSKK